MKKGLNVRQKKFSEIYDGNGTESARKAGYNGSDNVLAQTARHLLTIPQIAEAIKSRQSKESNSLIANRQTRQEFWTKIMQDERTAINDRLRASELLGKSEADFTDKVVSTDQRRMVLILPSTEGAGADK